MWPERRLAARFKGWRAALLSYSVAAVCLYLVFRGIRLPELVDSLAAVQWLWVLPAILLDLLAYLCVGWQWQMALIPAGRLSVLRLTQAVFAGRFANDVLPVHIGYVIRVYLVSRWMNVPIAKVIPSLLVERLCEGFWLALGIAVAAAFVKLPGEVLRSGEILGAVLCAGALLTFLLVRRSRPESGTVSGGWLGRTLGRTLGFVQRLAEGVAMITRAGLLAAVSAAGLLKLLVQGLAFFCLLWAYGLQLPFWTNVAVFLIACVGLSLPSTPASTGVFQLFCVGALTLFGVARPVATGFALLAFIVLTAPLAIAGFFALAHSGLSLSEVRTRAGEWREAMKQ